MKFLRCLYVIGIIVALMLGAYYQGKVVAYQDVDRMLRGYGSR